MLFPSRIGLSEPQLERYRMIDAKLLKLIQCPLDGQSLEIAPDDLIAQLNDQIASKRLRDAIDQLVIDPLDQGLLTADRTRLYPVRGGIPTLIAEQAIPINDPSNRTDPID